MLIEEIANKNDVKQLKPIKEKQDIFIPNINDENISRRNGMVYVLSGSGGSGKTSLLLSMFKSKNYYRNKFDNIYYFCPASSFDSVASHPFATHDKVYNELTVQKLEDIYNELAVQNVEKAINKKGTQSPFDPRTDHKRNCKDKNKTLALFETGFEEDEEEETQPPEEPEIEYSAIIIDDFADALKDVNIQKQLSKMMIKARHLKTAFIFTLQSYYYFPKLLRKQITYATIFKPKNAEEWTSIAKELINLNKDDSVKLYDYIFNEPYAHLDLDLVTNRLYKNFNLLLLKK